MKIKKSYYLFTLLLLLSGALPAQQVNLTNLYTQSHYLVNAASAGEGDDWEAWTGYRNQWAGMKNSPSQAYISLTGRLGQRNGMGVFIGQSKAGLLSNLNGKLSYAYHLPLSAKSTLHAGTSVGLVHQKFNASDVIATDYSDDVLQGNQSATAMNTDVGLMLTTTRFRFGVAAIQLLHSNTFISESNANLLDYVIVHGSYNIVENETWLWQGIAAYRNSDAQKQQIDIGSRLVWKDRFGVGAGYRTDNGMFFRSELKIDNKISFAYSYELGSSRSRKSHEFMLGIKLHAKKQSQAKNEFDRIPEPIVEEKQEPESVPNSATGLPHEDIPAHDPVAVDSKEKTIDLDSLNKAFATSDKLIMFELNSPDKILSGNQDGVLNEVVKILHEDPALSVTIVGHSCKLGSAEFNQEISAARAKEVAMALQARGISPALIEYLGKGESEPATDGTSPTELAKNRRVQIMFSFQKME